MSSLGAVVKLSFCFFLLWISNTYYDELYPGGCSGFLGGIDRGAMSCVIWDSCIHCVAMKMLLMIVIVTQLPRPLS
ncbi:hypothetical protein KY290_011297 [Solanum tuberosum]|uniref:Uncharacterized protein n=1 Tax=Solanum tuberosum TaxID=4113 RepID=A0ABQ7W087_SOLTU|nr:hypothetical protein KY290_011297 [Solanum tuberosum]